MDPIEFLHRAIDRAGELPGLRYWRARLYDRRFGAHAGGKNVYRGVFSSFEEAARSAPHHKPVGYDNHISAQIYANRLERILPSDYPVMYWLERFFLGGCQTVLDVGGNIGNCYYAYSRYLTAPRRLRWVVSDVPAVIDMGRTIARTHDRALALVFVDRIEDAESADILLANGALQFLPVTTPELVVSLKAQPKYMIVNRMPLHPTESFFTLQAIGSAFCPYRIDAEADFVNAIASLGYRAVDRWQVPELKCVIPFFPHHSVNGYAGFCFERISR